MWYSIVYVVNEEFTLSSFQMSLSGSIFSRPSMLSVQPLSQGGRVDATVTAHSDMPAASSSVSGFSSAFKRMMGKILKS